VTNDASAVADLGPNRGRRLTADAGFARAADAAPVPDRATTWSYVDVERALPLADAFARLAGTRVSDATLANVRPLRATLTSTTRDGLDQTTDLFLATD
jgi:hypothetical protein